MTRHRADQEPIEILLIFFTICLIQVTDSWGKDGKGLFDMGWNGKSSSRPSRSLYMETTLPQLIHLGISRKIGMNG